MEAVAAVDRLGTRGLERHLGLHAATGADCIVHLALGTSIATAATTAAATGLLGCIPARFALFGFVKAFGLVKFLFFISEDKNVAASSTGNVLFHVLF